MGYEGFANAPYMRRILLLFVVLFFFQPVFAKQGYDSLLIKLNNILEKKKDYDAEKLARIDKLQQDLNNAPNPDLNFKYNIYLKFYEEYKSFNYAKAFYYAKKLQQTGDLLKDPAKIAYSRIKFGFISLSSGMFKEAFDTLKNVNVKLLDNEARREYYFLTARTYYDLADYDKDDYYTPIYNSRAGKYIDSSTALCKPSSFEYIYYTGLKYLKTGNVLRAVNELKTLVKEYHLTDHQFAVTASTLSDIYIRNNQPDSAISLLIPAAMADIRSSTKEAAAMMNLAQLLHKKGDVNNAYIYINEALDDAAYYGARQREIQVNAILPVIAGDRINSVEGQRRVLFFYALSLTVLSLLVVVFAVIIYKQLRKLRIADKIIIETNHHLLENVDKLNEANKIKEEYIGYYFNLISEYINKLDKFKRSVDNKLTTKRFDDIRILVNNINLSKEREELFINFDKAFLKIFPNFVESYNALFHEESHVKLLPNQLLNTDLRIFALIRLGISDTEKIAHILEYSVNTIYNYKARIKAKSLISNDEFENAIMGIKAL
ncbi:MAG: Transcriptional regulator [Mucilaginibacter sp.]|nr:Transcriptional regulator [Mucilaginibacter sp.]